MVKTKQMQYVYKEDLLLLITHISQILLEAAFDHIHSSLVSVYMILVCGCTVRQITQLVI